MVRLLLEDVALTRDEQISVNIRFKGGAIKTLILPIPLSAGMTRKTRPETVEEVDRLLDHHHDTEIASIFNNRGIQTGDSLPFTAIAVRRIRRAYDLKDRYTRLREKGMLTRKEMLKFLGASQNTLKNWTNKGWIKTHHYGNTIQSILYEPPGEDFYVKIKENCLYCWKNIPMGAQEVARGVV